MFLVFGVSGKIPFGNFDSGKMAGTNLNDNIGGYCKKVRIFKTLKKMQIILHNISN